MALLIEASGQGAWSENGQCFPGESAPAGHALVPLNAQAIAGTGQSLEGAFLACWKTPVAPDSAPIARSTIYGRSAANIDSASHPGSTRTFGSSRLVGIEGGQTETHLVGLATAPSKHWVSHAALYEALRSAIVIVMEQTELLDLLTRFDVSAEFQSLGGARPSRFY